MRQVPMSCATQPQTPTGQALSPTAAVWPVGGGAAAASGSAVGPGPSFVDRGSLWSGAVAASGSAASGGPSFMDPGLVGGCAQEAGRGCAPQLAACQAAFASGRPVLEVRTRYVAPTHAASFPYR